MSSRIFRKHIAIPQDHGSWVFILSPLLIGMMAGKTFTYATFNLIAAALAAFMLRQPASVLVKILAGRRTTENLSATKFWISIYSSTTLLAIIALVLQGFGFVVYLAIPGLLIFGWHLWLVSRREERKQAGVEIMATGVLSLAAPAAYWVGTGQPDPAGWWLWVLVWMQGAASIVYTYLRLEQRDQEMGAARGDLWKKGFRAAAFATFNLASSLTLALVSVLPPLIFIPYLLQWTETMWGIFHPASGWKPTRIGIRQLIVSSAWTVLFILTWRP